MAYYANQLMSLVQNPAGYTGSPGYQARLDRALQATQRAGSSMLGSGNYLSALMDTANSVVSDDYDKEFSRRAGLAENEQQGARADASLNLQGQQIAQQGELGRGNLGLGFYNAGNSYDLGSRAADTADNRAWYDYSLGRDRNNIDAANSTNSYNIASGRNAIDWYNAGTSRGAAQSQDWWNPQRQARQPLTRRYP